MKRLKALFAGLALGTLFGAMLDPERRERVKKMAKELREKVAERTKNLTEVSKEAYDKIVDATVAEYKEMKSVTSAELKHVTRELKGAWHDVKKTVKK